jgi:catalase
MAKSSRHAKTAKNKSTVRNSRTTVSGPAASDASGAGDIAAEKAAGTQDVASAFPFNPNKAAEYDPDAALAPPKGASVKPDDPIVGASTVSEVNGSDKAGSGGPNIGQNPTVGSLDRVRVDSSDRVLTTNQGVPIADNQNSLKAGWRGPSLLEDFILPSATRMRVRGCGNPTSRRRFDHG